MNEVLQNILTRRSVRAFKEEQLKDEELDLILQAGVNAPSGMNKQSYKVGSSQLFKAKKRWSSLQK